MNRANGRRKVLVRLGKRAVSSYIVFRSKWRLAVEGRSLLFKRILESLWGHLVVLARYLLKLSVRLMVFVNLRRLDCCDVQVSDLRAGKMQYYDVDARIRVRDAVVSAGATSLI
jgi:hypothetical protein